MSDPLALSAPLEFADQLDSVASRCARAGFTEQADALTNAAQVLREAIPFTELDEGDRVRVNALAVAVVPDLESYEGVVMVVDSVQGYSVSVEHPSEGSAHFTMHELEKVND